MNIKKAIIIGALTSIGITLTAFGIKYHIFKPKATTPVIQSKADYETDLNDTIWHINTNPTLPQQYATTIEVAMNFHSNGESFDYLTINYTGIYFDNPQYRQNGGLWVYDPESNPSWENNNYKTITIDEYITDFDTNIRQWLNNNATQEITDLANTYWQFNPESTFTQNWTPNENNSYFQANLTFEADGQNFTSIKAYYNDAQNQPTYLQNALIYTKTNNEDIYSRCPNGAFNNKYRIIHILTNSNTTNVTNIEFITTYYIKVNGFGESLPTIHNLTKTKWKWNDILPTPYLTNRRYEIIYQSYGQQYEVLMPNSTGDNQGLIYAWYYENLTLGGVKAYFNNSNTWNNNNYKNIVITNGQDKTNTNLIDYLLQWATYDGIQITPLYEEPIDLKGLMLDILSMPFTFITQAFNVTLWPNTPYEFNFSNFIKGLIAIASILFIIKLFTSGFSVIGNFSNKQEDRKLNKEYKKSQINKNNSIANKNNKKE